VTRANLEVTVNVRLSHEAAPPWIADEERLNEYLVPLTLTADELIRAADDWVADNDNYPPRHPW
jgi:hypothetical protein